MHKEENKMYDFDAMPTRAGSDSVKWAGLGEDVIPMWVADMDFKSPQPILDAVMERAAHPYWGYPIGLDKLTEVVIGHYKRTYGAHIEPEWIVWVPSVIPGKNSEVVIRIFEEYAKPETTLGSLAKLLNKEHQHG